MDRTEIIERLKNIAGHAVHTTGEEPFVMSIDDGIAVHEAIELLTNCPEIPDSWIPVSERLPIKEFEEGFKNGTVYNLYPCLVSRTAKHSPVNPDRIYVAKHYFDGEDFLNVGAQVVTDEVIAWMPLPEPWKGDNDGQTD